MTTSPEGTPVRVLLVVASLRYVGGQSIQAVRLRDRLRADGNVLADILEVDPVLPRPLRWLQSIKFVRTVVTSAAYVVSLVRRVPGCDVVHAYSASYWSFLLAPVPAMIVGRVFGKRVILNYHSGEAPDHLARWGWHAVPLARLAHRIVVPSDYLAEVFARFGLCAQRIVNSLDVERVPFRRRSAPLRRHLTNRGFEAHYNVPQAVEAFAQVRTHHPDATLVIVGDGPARAEVEAAVERVGDAGVCFLGSVCADEMLRLYDEADVLLNASLIDNQPLTILEAFAAGLPVVTSDAGGIPWMVRDGDNGTLVPAGDAEALARAALALLADPARALAMAERARAEALEKYTWEAVRPQWLAVYGARGDMTRVAPPPLTPVDDALD